MILDKKHLEHLAELARINLKAGEEEKLLKDLGNILNYFKELEALDTGNVTPISGGTELTNKMRVDEVRADRLGPEEAVEQFPEKEGRYLKVPPVFE